MKLSQHDLDQAAEKASAAREKLSSRFRFARQRLQPARLMADARQEANERAEDAARSLVEHGAKHPVMIGIGLIGLALWGLRHQLVAHAPGRLQKIYGWLSGNLPFSAVMEQGADKDVETSR